MLDSELNVNRFLVSYCRMLVGDVADERLAEQPLPGVNHPAWILGHLAFSADRACSLLDAPKELRRPGRLSSAPARSPRRQASTIPRRMNCCVQLNRDSSGCDERLQPLRRNSLQSHRPIPARRTHCPR